MGYIEPEIDLSDEEMDLEILQALCSGHMM
jgi:hypothetical protein